MEQARFHCLIEKLPVKGKMHAKNEFLRPMTGNFCNLFFFLLPVPKTDVYFFLFNQASFRKCDVSLEFLE